MSASSTLTYNTRRCAGYFLGCLLRLALLPRLSQRLLQLVQLGDHRRRDGVSRQASLQVGQLLL
jgi:hypothetical protein